MTISWNMHGMNLKAMGQKETEKNKYAVTVINLSGSYLATHMLLLNVAALCLYLSQRLVIYLVSIKAI
jgi:hypothetical protein